MDTHGFLPLSYLVSAPGSTEYLVGERRALALETSEGEDRDALYAEIDRLVEEERIKGLDLPPTERVTLDDMRREEASGTTRIPPNQLAHHGDWYVKEKQQTENTKLTTYHTHNHGMFLLSSIINIGANC